MTQTADLHIHTCFSDGVDTPQQVVSIALEKELRCIAITDHDTLDAIEPAAAAAQGTGLEVIHGVELSTECGGSDIHILGYCFDLHHHYLKEQLQLFRDARVIRVKKMAERLRALGMEIDEEDIFSSAGTDAVGRPHVAQAIITRGYARTTAEAFEEYLAEGRPAYVAKYKQTPSDAIKLIRQAGGIAVIAHPMVTLKDELIAGFVDEGLGGLEVYYPNTPRRLIVFYEKLAEKYGLIKTGGSDSHGRYREYSPIGIARVDYAVVEALKDRAARLRP